MGVQCSGPELESTCANCRSESNAFTCQMVTSSVMRCNGGLEEIQVRRPLYSSLHDCNSTASSEHSARRDTCPIERCRHVGVNEALRSTRCTRKTFEALSSPVKHAFRPWPSRKTRPSRYGHLQTLKRLIAHPSARRSTPLLMVLHPRLFHYWQQNRMSTRN